MFLSTTLSNRGVCSAKHSNIGFLFNSSFLMEKKNLLPRFFTTRIHPRFIKRNFTLFFFRFCSGLQVKLICIYEFSFFSLSTDNEPILQGHQLFNSAFSLAQFGILSKISRLLAHSRVSVAI